MNKSNGQVMERATVHKKAGKNGNELVEYKAGERISWRARPDDCRIHCRRGLSLCGLSRARRTYSSSCWTIRVLAS